MIKIIILLVCVLIVCCVAAFNIGQKKGWDDAFDFFKQTANK